MASDRIVTPRRDGRRDGRRRARLPVLLLALPLLSGCEGAVGPVLAVNGASLVLTGRDVPGLVVSAVTGRDCSVAHLDRGEGQYCRREAAPAPVPHCTRSLGGIDCWTGQPPGLPPPRAVADTPAAPVAPSQGWLLDRLF